MLKLYTLMLSLHCDGLNCTVLYCAVLYCIVLYCTVLHCIVLYCAIFYCTVLHHTVLTLYSTALYGCLRLVNLLCRTIGSKPRADLVHVCIPQPADPPRGPCQPRLGGPAAPPAAAAPLTPDGSASQRLQACRC